MSHLLAALASVLLASPVLAEDCISLRDHAQALLDERASRIDDRFEGLDPPQGSEAGARIARSQDALGDNPEVLERAAAYLRRNLS